MHREAHDLSVLSSPKSSTPRAVWIGGALLGLVAAGLAGALIMRSVDSNPAAPAPASQDLSAAPAAAAPALEAQQAAPAPAAPAVPSKAAAPAHAKARTPAPVAATPASHDRTEQAPAGDTVARADASAPAAPVPAPVAVCTTCGVVESVNAVTHKGQGSGVGAAAGGVLGGVVGHQMGGGKGKTAMTILGAVGGALAGNEVEKRTRSETVYDVQVRMEDGSTRVFQQSQPIAIGAHVVADGSTLRIASSAPKGAQP